MYSLGICTFLSADGFYSYNTNHMMPYIISDLISKYLKTQIKLLGTGRMFSTFLIITPNDFNSVFKVKDNYGIMEGEWILYYYFKVFFKI